jgi:hypothetical protein
MPLENAQKEGVIENRENVWTWHCWQSHEISVFKAKPHPGVVKFPA